MQVLTRILCVAIGSACGGVLRWVIGIGTGRLIETEFPLATFFINVSGSMFLGWFLTRLPEWSIGGYWFGSDNMRLLIAIGLCGGYTTFSSFQWESFGLFRDNQGMLGTMYVIGSVVVGLIALRIGVALGGR